MMDDAEYDPFDGYHVWDHPVDHLEPELSPSDKVRDAQMMTVHLLNDFATEMLEALSGQNPVRSALIRLFGISYAMGLSICGEVSMADRAAQIGCERASLSKFATHWNTAHDLPPSFHQKCAAAAETYAAVRREVVQSNGAGHKRNRPLRMPVPPRGRSV